MPHMPRAVAVTPWCLVLLLSACPGGPGTKMNAPTGANYKFTADGTGPTNAAPLDPLADGTLRYPLMIDGRVDLPAGRARRAIDQSNSEVTYIFDTTVGLFIGGGFRDGILKYPVLTVPSTVRVGMKWEVTLEGPKPAYTFEVTDRTEGPSVFGKKTVQWTIVNRDANGAPAQKVYTEGYGIAGVSFTVEALDTKDPEPSPAPRVTVEPMPGSTTPEFYLPAAKIGQTTSMVHVTGHDALLMYTMDNDRLPLGLCFSVNTAGVTSIGGTEAPTYFRAAPEVCPVMRAPPHPGDQPFSYGQHASGAFVEPDGTVTWIPRKFGKPVGSGNSGIEGQGNPLFAVSLMPGDNGGVDMFFQQGGTDVAHLGGRSLFGLPAGTEYSLPDTFFAFSWKIDFISPLTADDGDRRTLLIRTEDMMLWLVTVKNTGMTVPLQVGRLAGTFSVQTTENGTEILRVLGDGWVDRLHLNGDVVTLEPLANVDVGPGLVLDSAFVLRDPGGDKLITTMFDFKTMDAKMFRSTGVISASTERRSLRADIALLPGGGNADTLMCVPGTTGGVTTTGWTLGDAPATAIEVTPGKRCVLSVRGAGQTALTQGTSDGTTIGSFPGIGRVVGIGIQGLASSPTNTAYGFALNTQNYFAPLKGGTVAHPTRRYGRGLYSIGMRSLAPRLPGIYGPLLDMWFEVPMVDMRGEGIWGMRKAFTLPNGGNTWDLIDFGVGDFHRTYTETLELKFMSQKGGLVTYQLPPNATQFQWVRVATDGTETQLTNTPYVAYQAELNDGTLCGDLWNPAVSMQLRYECVPPTGAPRIVPSMYSMRGATPLSDGSLLLPPQFTKLERLDTTTMAITPYLSGHVWLGVGSDSTVFGVVIAADGDIELYRMEPSGPKRLTAHGDYNVSVYGMSPDHLVVVDDDVIGVIGYSTAREMTLVRIPRPKP